MLFHGANEVQLWIRELLNDINASRFAYSTPQVIQQMQFGYQMIGARLPKPHIYRASDLTIAAGSDTFTLSSREYAADVRIRLRSTGEFLTKRTAAQIDARRQGNPTVVLGRPREFCLWEEVDVHAALNTAMDNKGRVFPGAKSAEVCDVFHDFLPGSLPANAAGDWYIERIELGKGAAHALALHVAARLLAKLPADELERLKLERATGAIWDRDAETLIYRESVRMHQIQSAGGWVGGWR